MPHPRSLGSVAAAAVLALALGLPCPAAAQTMEALQRKLLETIEELQRKQVERDAIIADLLRRMEMMERRAGARPAGAEPPVRAEAAPHPVPTPRRGVGGAAPPPGVLPPTGAQTAGPAPSAQAEGAAPRGPAPGQFEVDEEAVQRALERALVQTGALLLEPGTVEIEPRFSYRHGQQDTPVLFGPNAANLERRRDVLQAEVAFRFGLPFDSQLELDLPYVFEEESDTVVGLDENSRRASGMGDLGITLSKALLRESGWWPDLTANLRWDSHTGRSQDVGSGFDELIATVSAVKRIDPLAFVGSLFYTTALERQNTDPGDVFGVSLGPVLATSPDTSLRFSLNQSFRQDAEVDGRKVAGSDQVIGSLTLGGSIVLNPRILLDVSADIGLTDAAEDYAVRVALPIRFDLPIPSDR